MAGLIRLRPRADPLFRRRRGAGNAVKFTDRPAFQSTPLDIPPQATGIGINVPHLHQRGFIASGQFIPMVAAHVMI